MQNTIIHGKALAAAAAVLLLCAASLYSQDTSETAGRESAETAIVLDEGPATALTGSPESDSPGSVWVLLRIVLVLVIVCAGIYGVVYLLKKSSGTSAANDPYIRVVAQLPLAPGKSVQILTVGSQAFLVGLSESGIQNIAEITDRELVDAMNLEADRNPREPVPPFSALLSRFMPKAGSGGETAAAKQKNEESAEPLSAGETADFIRRQRERLGKTGRNESGSRTGRSE